MIHLKGERYEYEINMLIFAQKRQLTINEIPIQTLYFNHNSGSHYHSIKDSLRVFKKLLSGLILYSFATLASGFIDIVSFILFNRFFADQPLQVRLFWATFLARTLSYFCNFLMNRTFVFKGGNQFIQSIVKYYVLFFGFITSSYFFVLSANLYLNVNIILTKILVDGQALLKCINGYIYWQQLSSCFFGSIRKGNFHSVRIWAKNRYFV
jgi:hypothetical protein